MNNPNTSLTAGCRGTEGNCAAAILACANLKSKMSVVKEKEENVNMTWPELVKKCHLEGVDLTGHHMNHAIIDKLAPYTIWGAIVTEVQVDVLTGMIQIRRCDLIEDTGTPTSPIVDLGQIEGGLIMGFGLWTSEQVPTCHDIPNDLRIELYDSGNNSNLVLGSKAVGEPSVLGGVSAFFAIRQAIMSARRDGGLQEWIQLDGPATVEKIKLACAVSESRLIF